MFVFKKEESPVSSRAFLILKIMEHIEILNIVKVATELIRKLNRYSTIETFTVEDIRTGRYMATGWGNGYATLPEEHPYYKMDYDEINSKGIDVYGGLTYSNLHEGKYTIGFDTGHFDDSLQNWPEERVIRETAYLKEQLIWV